LSLNLHTDKGGQLQDKIERYHAAHSWFARNQQIYKSSRHLALENICHKVAEVINVDRVGVWFFTIDKDAIFEELTFVSSGDTSQGHIILSKDYQDYFSAINSQRVVVIDQNSSDSLLIKAYMRPLGIRTSMDAPIFSDGEMVGILCCEETRENRRWDIHDKSFAAGSADFIGRIIEAEKRHTYEKELRHRISYLENDLKRKLDDLNEAKLSLDLALESALVGKWDWDLEVDKFTLNKTWFSKLGYEFNELPQDISTFRGALHPDDVLRVFQDLYSHILGETQYYECRYRMITKSGEIQWCLDRGCINQRKNDGTPIRMTGVNVNITPMVKWEQSLSISEQQLKAMIQSLPTPVAMFDKDFRYIAFSSRWSEEWDFISEAKEGDSIGEFLKIIPDWMEKLNDALRGQTLSKDEDLIELTTGSNYWLRWVIQPWKNSNQEIGGVIIMAENITSRKETEMRLTQASKLSALGEMAGGIAHEINNPLSIIKGYIDLLRRHSGRSSLSPELLKHYIQKMDQTVGRISRIVSGMRRFSRETSLDEKVKYPLNKIVEETLDICLERINNNGTAVNVEYLSNEPLVLCRPVEISQVLLNLINNSFQASSNFDHPWIKIQLKELDDMYRISVSDSGVGISPMVRKKIFQPFFTTKEVGTGTGLGLSISRGIIEGHNGRLYYQDDSANTTFVIELPKDLTPEN